MGSELPLLANIAIVSSNGSDYSDIKKTMFLVEFPHTVWIPTARRSLDQNMPQPDDNASITRKTRMIMKGPSPQHAQPLVFYGTLKAPRMSPEVPTPESHVNMRISMKGLSPRYAQTLVMSQPYVFY